MDITIYSTSTCGYCRALSEWLDEQKISYKKVVIDKEPDGMALFMSVNDGAISVPLSVIKDASGTETKISGFDKDKLEKLDRQPDNEEKELQEISDLRDSKSEEKEAEEEYERSIDDDDTDEETEEDTDDSEYDGTGL